MNSAHELLVYADVSLLGESTTNNTETIVVTIKETGLEENA